MTDTDPRCHSRSKGDDMTDAYKTIWLDYGKDWFNARLTGNETCVEYIRADLARPIAEAEDTIAVQAATIKSLVEALEWQSEVIDNAITENEIGGHRLFLDDKYHMGPVVDWVHTILTGFSKINRATLANLS